MKLIVIIVIVVFFFHVMIKNPCHYISESSIVVSWPHLIGGWPLGAGPGAGGAGAGHEAGQTGDPRACIVHSWQDAKPVAGTDTLEGDRTLLGA